MGPLSSYRELEVWQKAIDLAVRAWQSVRSMPRTEQFAFGDQLIRSSASIASNIAEGYGRDTRPDYLRFLHIANGSRCEFETRIEICLRAKLFSEEIAAGLRSDSERVGQMLTRLRQSLRTHQ
jgi:four helix bundle protein